MGWSEDIANIIPAEKNTFLAYYIGVYESIQKFVGAIVNEGEGYYCLSCEGKLKTNVAPLPSVLPSPHVFPPCASTIFFEMNNPRPVPISDSVANIVNSLGKISGPIVLGF
jgi:hypothetical protein